MKQRIFTGWNFNRLLFTGIGTVIILSSIRELEWIGILAGIYFLVMGIFAFGCASGSCSVRNGER